MLTRAALKAQSSSIATWPGVETLHRAELTERPLGLLLQHGLPDLWDLEEPSLLPLQAGVGRRVRMVPWALHPSILPLGFMPPAVVRPGECDQKVAGSTRPWLMAPLQEALAWGQNRW